MSASSAATRQRAASVRFDCIVSVFGKADSEACYSQLAADHKRLMDSLTPAFARQASKVSGEVHMSMWRGVNGEV